VLLQVPGVRTLVVKLGATRFCYALALLHSSGLPIVHACKEASRTCGNLHLTERLERTATGLREGQTLTECLRAANVLPLAALSLVDVGEVSGKLDSLLTRAAAMMEEDVRDTLDRTVKALEPLTMAVLGVVVGFILVAAFLPIYTLVAQLQ
jgi:type II secretory pathway component PulF